MKKIDNVAEVNDQVVENTEEVTEVVEKEGLIKKLGNKIKNVDWKATGKKVAKGAGLITLGALGAAFALGRASKGDADDSAEDTETADDAPVETDDEVTTE